MRKTSLVEILGSEYPRNEYELRFFVNEIELFRSQKNEAHFKLTTKKDLENNIPSIRFRAFCIDLCQKSHVPHLELILKEALNRYLAWTRTPFKQVETLNDAWNTLSDFDYPRDEFGLALADALIEVMILQSPKWGAVDSVCTMKLAYRLNQIANMSNNPSEVLRNFRQKSGAKGGNETGKNTRKEFYEAAKNTCNIARRLAKGEKLSNSALVNLLVEYTEKTKPTIRGHLRTEGLYPSAKKRLSKRKPS